jgi:hypothetical protein
MQQRGDLVQLVIDLFRQTDAGARSAIADRIGDLAHEAAQTLTLATPAYELSPEERALVEAGGLLATLDDDTLEALNGLLPWAAMTGDGAGRVIGAAWNPNKRTKVAPLIDRRIADFDAAWPMADRHVLEVGCFEGIHTIGCLAVGARVTAVDVRMENILKTLARVWAYGLQADVRVWDLETGEPPTSVPARWDMLHHVGVLYHLTNPAEHLALALDRTDAALMLDTHVAEDEAGATGAYEALGRSFRYSRWEEHAISPFAGVRDHAKWLSIEDLEWICRSRGFTDVEVRQIRNESNGKRVLIWAFRPGARAAAALSAS